MGEARLAKRIGLRIAIWGFVVAFGALLLPGLFQSRRTSYERRPETSLKTIVSAQEEFRSKDSDGDGIRQFWRADVTGLYTSRPGGDPAKPIIKLIELSVACADDRPHNNDLEQFDG